MKAATAVLPSGDFLEIDTDPWIATTAPWFLGTGL